MRAFYVNTLPYVLTYTLNSVKRFLTDGFAGKFPGCPWPGSRLILPGRVGHVQAPGGAPWPTNCKKSIIEFWNGCD